MKQEAPHVNIERSIIKQFRKEIWRPFVKGLQDYEMIKDGDKVAVCISGGKDSMLLAKCLQQLKRQSRTDFELEFIVMDPGYNPDNRKLIEDNAALMNIPVRIFDSDIFDIVVDVEQSPCYLCARMRRGYLYAHASCICLTRLYMIIVLPQKTVQKHTVTCFIGPQPVKRPKPVYIPGHHRLKFQFHSMHLLFI